MGDTNKNCFVVLWDMIEDYYFGLFQKCKNLTTLITPEVERDYYEFRQVMRETVNEASDLDKIAMQTIYRKLPGNRWIPIMVHLAHRDKAKRKSVSEMNREEKAKYLREGDKFWKLVNDKAEKIARGDNSGVH